jgi:hypothetical protein
MIQRHTDISPKVVTDEAGRPVSVVLPYADWLKLNGEAAQPDLTREQIDARAAAINALRGTWPELEDGMTYQNRAREEWA